MSNTSPTLFLMLGFPGAGKTTTAKMIAAQTGAVRLSSDEFRLAMFPQPQFTAEEHTAVYGALDYLTELLLSSGISVIYDANLNRFAHRQEKYAISQKTNATAKLVWIKTGRELSKQRATEQGTDNPIRPFGNLSSETFDRLANEIEPPTAEEQAIELNGARVSESDVAKALESL